MKNVGSTLFRALEKAGILVLAAAPPTSGFDVCHHHAVDFTAPVLPVGGPFIPALFGCGFTDPGAPDEQLIRTVGTHHSWFQVCALS